MSAIRRQVEQLDMKMAELQRVVDSQESDAEPIVLDLDDLPFFDDSEPVSLPEPESVSEPVAAAEEVAADEETVADADVAVEPAVAEIEEEPVLEQVMESEQEPEVIEPEQNIVKVAVIDAMTDRQAWRKDMPGTAVRDVRSAISLNDRVLFINTLFGEDPVRFQEVLTCINQMSGLDEAVDYLVGEYPGWDLESDTVYRFMMAVRRKLS